MEAIAAQTKVNLRQAAARRVLRAGEWMAVRGADEQWTGSVRVQLADRAAAEHMAILLRGFAVRVEGVVGIFDVHSPYLPDWATTSSATASSGFRTTGPPPSQT